jgi:hypothetical protein
MAANALAAHAPRSNEGTPTGVVSPFDLDALDRIERVEQIGSQTVIARTTEGREVRITATRDLRAGKYRAEYEHRVTLNTGGKAYTVWALTPAHGRVVAADAKTCVEQALRDVNRLRLY